MCDGRWWIDYLCINQADLVERAEQVRLMQQVYDRAHEVIVWLGDQSSDSDRAFNFIKLHDKIIQEANSDKQTNTQHIEQHHRISYRENGGQGFGQYRSSSYRET